MKRAVFGAALAATCAGPSMAQNVSGTFSATLSGFQPTPSYSQLSASSAASSSVALPSGTTIVVYNTGANDAYVTLGGPTVVATTSGDVVKAGGWMAFTVGANGYLAAITASGATGLNISGGLGLPTGTAGTMLPSLPAGSNTIGGVTLPPQTSGGWTPKMLANLSTAQVVKASAGQVVRVQCDNISGSSAAYVQLLNIASSPSLGSNQVGYVPLAVGGTGGFTLSGMGVQFSSGISIGAATTASGSTAVSAPVNCEVDYN